MFFRFTRFIDAKFEEHSLRNIKKNHYFIFFFFFFSFFFLFFLFFFSFFFIEIDILCAQVGGFDGSAGLNSAEVYDVRTREWRSIARMSTRRSSVGVGVVKGLLYAVSVYFT